MKALLANSALTSRLLGAVLAFELSKDMVTSGSWLLQPASMMGRVAQLSSSPEVYGYLWMSLSAFVTPYLVLQITDWGATHRTWITRLACWAVLCSGVLWVYLSYLSKNLDIDYITEIFLLHGATCIAMSAVLANGLNAAQRLRQEPEA